VLQVPDNLTHNSIMSSAWDVEKQFLGKGWERSEKRVVFRIFEKRTEFLRKSGWSVGLRHRLATMSSGLGDALQGFLAAPRN
jgi:hypothetical protein